LGLTWATIASKRGSGTGTAATSPFPYRWETAAKRVDFPAKGKPINPTSMCWQVFPEAALRHTGRPRLISSARVRRSVVGSQAELLPPTPPHLLAGGSKTRAGSSASAIRNPQSKRASFPSARIRPRSLRSRVRPPLPPDRRCACPSRRLQMWRAPTNPAR
jgi:hypothetical protein